MYMYFHIVGGKDMHTSYMAIIFNRKIGTEDTVKNSPTKN